MKPLLTTIFVLSALCGFGQSKHKIQNLKNGHEYYVISAITLHGNTLIGCFDMDRAPNLAECKIILSGKSRIDTAEINVMAVCKATKEQFDRFNDKPKIKL